MADKAAAILLLTFGGLMYLAAERLPEPMYESLGAGFFPKLLCIVLGILSLWLLGQSILARRTATAAPSGASAGGMSPGTLRMLVCGGITVAYVVALSRVGFIWATSGFLLGIMGYLSHRSLRELGLILIIGIVYVALVYFSFTWLLRIFLP